MENKCGGYIRTIKIVLFNMIVKKYKRRTAGDYPAVFIKSRITKSNMITFGLILMSPMFLIYIILSF